MNASSPKTIGFLVVFFALTLGACVHVPETGERVFMVTSESQEIQMGEQGYQEVLATAKISKDARLNAILQRVGKRIAKAANRPDYKWEFTLIESEEMNAWCMPGGKIAVYTGILPIMKNEAGMAAVMGHEVAHATLRHSGQRISQHMGYESVMGILANGFGDSKAGQLGLGALGLGAQFGVLLPFSRKHESESDRIGLRYMAKAGYDPKEAVALWQRFGSATAGKNPPEFMSTHPNPSTRIQDLQAQQSNVMPLYNASPKHGLGETF